jgi:hypothetical protein
MKAALRLIVPMVLVAGVVLAGETADKEAQAIDAGQQWLSLCDQAKYGESWEMAATFFKNAVTREQWEQMATAVRSPLGQLEKRDVKSRKYQTSVAGAPDGEYVIIQFSTVFKNKKEAIETVTMMLDKDRGWRVSGYFIK